MLKLIAVVGTQSKVSYNRMLLQFMSRRYRHKADVEVTEIDQVPLYDKEAPVMDPHAKEIAEKIQAADGVIFATPEYDHSITAALKSTLEWLSWKIHPLKAKPVMIVGASISNLGTVQAQESLKQILDAPGLDACVLGGNQFLLGHAESAFNGHDLKDQGTIDWLDHCFFSFIEFVRKMDALDAQTSATQAYLTHNTDVTTSASEKVGEDAQTSASKKTNVTTGPSQNEVAGRSGKQYGTTIENEKSYPDETTGASFSDAKTGATQNSNNWDKKQPDFADNKQDGKTGASKH